MTSAKNSRCAHGCFDVRLETTVPMNTCQRKIPASKKYIIKEKWRPWAEVAFALCFKKLFLQRSLAANYSCYVNWGILWSLTGLV